MTDLTPSKPVLAVGLNRRGGAAAVERVMGIGRPVVLLAERGFPVPAGVVDHIEVPMNRARIGRAVKEATRVDASWVAVPRTMGTSDYLLSASVRSVGKHLDAEHPGMAVLVAAERGPHDPASRKGLAVMDLNGPASSGWALLAAVQIAIHSKAALDILVLGIDPIDAPASPEEWLSLVPMKRRTDLVREALHRAEQSAVPITWIAGATGDRAETIMAVVRAGSYDAVLDDLGGHHLRKRIASRSDVRRLLDDPAHGAVLREVLNDTVTDVVIVIDGISLGLVSAAAVRTSAAAALAMGAVSLATPVAAQTAMSSPGSTAPALTVTRPVQAVGLAPRTDAKDRASRDDERSEAPDATAKSGPQATKKATTKASKQSDTVTAADVTKAKRKSANAEQQAREAQQAASRAERRAQEAEKQLAKAKQKVDAARDQADPAASELKQARLELRVARLAKVAAEEERAAAEQAVNVLTDTLTRGRVSQEAERALAQQRVAAYTAGVAEAQAEAAYEEYLDFAAEVEAAEELLSEADRAAQRKQAEAEAEAAEAEQARKRAAQLDKAAAQVEQAWAEQGLYQPATGRITSPFGPRVHPVTGVYKLHTGTDWSGADGNYYAAEDGVVSYAGYDGAYGYMVKVNHGRIDGNRVVTWYAHQPGLQVSVGDTVSRGEVIGRIGSTGYSTGAHAHVELRLNGQPVDITEYLH